MSCSRATFLALVALPLLRAGPARAACTSLAMHRDGQPLARHTAQVTSHASRQLTVLVTPVPGQPAAVPAGAAQVARSPHLMCLTGVVLGPNGQACPGVCVFPANNPRQLAVTNAEGVFQLQVPAHTALSLQAEVVGLGSSRLTLDDALAQPVRISLER